MSDQADDYVERRYLSREGIPLELGDNVTVRVGDSLIHGVITRYKSGDWVRIKTTDSEITMLASSVSIYGRPHQDLVRALISAEMAIHRAIALAETGDCSSLVESLRNLDKQVWALRQNVEDQTTEATSGSPS